MTYARLGGSRFRPRGRRRRQPPIHSTALVPPGRERSKYPARSVTPPVRGVGDAPRLSITSIPSRREGLLSSLRTRPKAFRNMSGVRYIQTVHARLGPPDGQTSGGVTARVLTDPAKGDESHDTKSHTHGSWPVPNRPSSSCSIGCFSSPFSPISTIAGRGEQTAIRTGRQLRRRNPPPRTRHRWRLVPDRISSVSSVARRTTPSILTAGTASPNSTVLECDPTMVATLSAQRCRVDADNLLDGQVVGQGLNQMLSQPPEVRAEHSARLCHAVVEIGL